MNTLIKNNALTPIRQMATALGLLVLAGFVVFLQPTPAQAQQGSAGALLEEIVTVARKRSDAEAVQDVPIAVTAFGAAQLDALFVTKLDDLSHLMPNVQLEQVGTFPGVQNFSIRGQGINSSIPSVDPTVGVFVDGVYLGVTFGSVVDMFDLESVEVLRGPQGLLFGRNVTGGAVLLRTKRPGDEFATRFRLGGNDEEQYNVAASIEGPLLDDTLSAKLVAYYDDDAGYFRNSNQQQMPAAPVPGAFYLNPATGRNVGEMTTKLVRPTLVWTPGDVSEWTLIVESGVSEGDGAVWANVTAQRAGVLPEFETTLDEMGFTDMKWTQATLETNIDEVGSGTLTNILGWRRTTALSGVDIDGTNLPIFAATGNTSQHQISNEIRWSGSFGNSWDATFGLYMFDQDIVYREGRIIQGGAVNLGLGGDMTGKNFGAFWSNDFHFNEDWTATVGLRYTDESKSTQIITAGCLDIVTFNCNRVGLSGDWQNITPKLGIERSFDGGRVYGFWSKGYRSGGFNFRNARPDVIPAGPTREEENNTFEIGLKTELGGGRMRLNVAAFVNEIKDMQRELNLPDPFVVVLQGTINAGDVTIQGIEADF
ncbi:MAG: TonB-dependent receptor, partial [Woeseiaceae bacterium]|nr:TonB-dependent receptor [Woeseiaceae bacterium]